MENFYDLEKPEVALRYVAMMVASFLAKHASLRHLEDELNSAGLEAWVKAKALFNENYGVLFKTFASRKVIGAIIDEARKLTDFYHKGERFLPQLVHLNDETFLPLAEDILDERCLLPQVIKRAELTEKELEILAYIDMGLDHENAGAPFFMSAYEVRKILYRLKRAIKEINREAQGI